ncbi:TPA: ABC transporter permease [Candidatus Micrarchaeota archaeon]|nr:ABC transporter permease [Candidatus Micrarchaeota archaeon]
MTAREARTVLSFITRNPVLMLSLIVVVGFVVLGLSAPYIVPYPDDAWGLEYNTEKRFLPPSWEHPFGTDALGRDVFSRVLLGTRFSLVIATGVVTTALAIGIPIGVIAGYYGGKLGALLMRVTDMFLAFPPLLLAIALAATLGRGLTNLIVALAISWWPWYARLVYVQTNSVKSMPFVDAARIAGVSDLKIMVRHVIPNALTPTVVQAALDMGSAILEAAGISFLGVGVKSPTPEWGLLISEGWMSINVAWWIAVFPGIAILITVVSFNLLADAIRESADPRLRRMMIARWGIEGG